MRAAVGDRLVVKGHKVGDHDVDGEILEVRGADGGPPFFVRWSDGHEGLVFPGADAVVQHFEDAQPDVLDQVERELNRWRAQVEELRVQAALAEMEVRQQVEPLMQAADDAVDALRRKVDDLRLAGHESWDAVRRDVDEIIGQVKAAAAATVAALEAAATEQADPEG